VWGCTHTRSGAWRGGGRGATETHSDEDTYRRGIGKGTVCSAGEGAGGRDTGTNTDTNTRRCSHTQIEGGGVRATGRAHSLATSAHAVAQRVSQGSPWARPGHCWRVGLEPRRTLGCSWLPAGCLSRLSQWVSPRAFFNAAKPRPWVAGGEQGRLTAQAIACPPQPPPPAPHD
jgi:hypothetical protein